MLCLGLSKLFFQGASILISWLRSPSAVILEPRKVKSVTASTFAPSVCHEVMGQDAMTLVFWILSFKPAFLLSLSPSSRGFLVPLHFLPLQGCQLHFWGMTALPQASCSGWSSPWLVGGAEQQVQKQDHILVLSEALLANDVGSQNSGSICSQVQELISHPSWGQEDWSSDPAGRRLGSWMLPCTLVSALMGASVSRQTIVCPWCTGQRGY